MAKHALTAIPPPQGRDDSRQQFLLDQSAASA